MKTITVKGIGTVRTKPDYIVILLEITEIASEYINAVNGANERIAKLQKAVQSAGFAKEDLKTRSFDVRTHYENYTENGEYKNRFAGYACEYSLKLSFDFDNKRLAQTLTAIANSGADAEQSISFTVKDPQKVSAELLKSAAQNAREKAEILCAASGVTLGELVNISYDWNDVIFRSNSSMYERGIASAMPLAAVPDFEPEDINSSDTAAFVWEIK